MKKRISTGLSLLLVLVLVSGCQSSSLAVPELISGRESSEKTSVVEYRNIYDLKAEDAWVSGARECVTAKTDGIVTGINKIVGERVKKGDVLLTTVSEELNSRYESLRQEISGTKQNHDTQLRVYQLERKKKTAELSYLKSGADKDASGEADAKEQSRLMKLCQAGITELDHSIAYENRVYQAKSKVQQEQLASLEKQRKQNILKAPCNGIIGQLLNGITIGSTLKAKQAAVMIYNTDCKLLNVEVEDYFGMPGEEDKSKQEAQDIKFFRLDKEYELTEYVYTQRQKRAGVSMQTSLSRCFTFDGIDELELGDMGKIVYKSNVKEHVLSLPNEAIKSTGQTKYVYVKQGDRKEKREVETGVKSSQYTELVSGLSEGDEVSYTAYEGMTANEILDLDRFGEMDDRLIPKVSETKAEKRDIDYSLVLDLEDDIESGEHCFFEPYRKYQVVDSYDSGVFEELLVSDGDTVKKGQPIAYIRHDVKQSELVSLQNEISASQRQLSQERLNYNKQVKEYKRQIAKADTAYERGQINYDLEIARVQYSLAVQSMNQGIAECRKELSKLKEKSAGVVKAPASGVVSESSVFAKGRSISPSNVLCTIIGTDSYILSVISYSEVHVNQRVSITLEDGSKHSGTVVFDGVDVYRGGSDDLMMLPAVSKDSYRIFIKADKELDYGLEAVKVEVSCPMLKNVLALPSGTIDGVSRNSDESNYITFRVNKKVGEHDYMRANLTASYCQGDSDWIIEGLSEGETVGYLDYSDVDWEAAQ